MKKNFVLYEKVVPYSLNGITFNWDLMKGAEYNYNRPNAGIPATAAVEVALFIGKIGLNINAKYTDSLTTASPTNVIAFLQANSFSVNEFLQQYNWEKITTMLNDSLPVMTFGETNPQVSPISGHAWVVDGYVHKKVTTYDVLTQTSTERMLYLVHCNYGWGGQCDGYYTSGVFDLRSVQEIVGSIGDRAHPRDKNYSYNVKII